MIWSLLKIAFFIVAVTAITFGATRLMEIPGGATITAGGVELSLSPLELAFAFVALLILLFVLAKLLGLLLATFRFLNGDETAISRYFTRNRVRKGYEALSEGMMALASGEGHLAMTKAARAERYLNDPKLTTLLTAQAAELAGDTKKAEDSYRKLLGDQQTRFVGVRGILKQKLREGDTETALALAEKAFALKPRHEETQDILLRLQAAKADWSGARATLGAKLKSGTLPRDVHKRRDAVLALSEAKDILDTGKDIAAREAAIEANRLSPDLIPAAVMAARSYIADGKPKYATRLLAKAWAAHPHPDLAAAFAEIAPTEKPTERLKRFGALTKVAPDHPETRMLIAELQLAAEDFPAARRAIEGLVTSDPTSRNLTLMAAIERGQGADDAVVRGWLTRALTAPRGPQWVCDNCQHIHGSWAPVCENCSAFDTLSWKRPQQGEVAMPAGTEMLPLIVGQVGAGSVADAEPETTIEPPRTP